MQAQFSNITISGISAGLPKISLDLMKLSEEFGEHEVKRIIANTGIRAVRVAEKGMQTSDLCFAAAQNLFEKLNTDLKTIDGIVFVSQTPDRIAPATSVLLQDRLGLPNNAVAFDINYGCSGYIYGLYQAALLLNAGGCQRVLVCSGDVITPLLHEKDRHVRMLLGDAGTATLVEKGDDSWNIALKSDGSGASHLTAAKVFPNSILSNDIHDLKNGYYHMDGTQVMGFALKAVPEIIDELLHLKRWHKSEVDTFVLHQPNFFMLNFLRKKMSIPESAVPIAVEDVGNTGPASIPLLLTMKGEELKNKQQLKKTILCGFGVGLSWGGIGLDLSKTQFFSPVEI